ncbi:MAG: AMP-binding protein [Actinomycetes bacterium]|jgi:acetyl-CoA synthetase|nr:AMP-binding protein [Actinomycetes bacterium]
MDALLKRYCPRIDFDDYADFYDNFRINEPDNFNFAYDIVDEWARLEPTKRALVWCDDHGGSVSQTFADISALSDRLARAFYDELGIRKGDVVLLVLRQRWEYWSVACALMKIGAIFVPASIQMTAKDFAYRAESAGFSTVIAVDDPYVVEQLDQACRLTDRIRTKVLVGSGERNADEADGKQSSDWLALEDLIERSGGAWTRPAGSDTTTNDDTLMLYFTSGTTGHPKMVRHTQVHPLGHIVTARYWQQVEENQLHCSVSDSGWAKFGWGKIYGQWICGATIFAYDWDRFEPTKLLQAIQDYGLRTFCAPPTMYRFMLQQDVASYDLSGVANFTTAGEPLNAEVSTRWEQLAGRKIREGFGQSEGSVLIATWRWCEPRPGCLGKPEPLYHIQLLADADTPDEHVADIGEEGAICVTQLDCNRPPGLFAGYYKDEQRTQAAFAHGRYNLGDMAWRDVDGYITFVGRNDDVIKASGYRIGPFEVESALVAHPAVIEAAVTGAPDPLRGTVVKADVILAAGFKPTDELRVELQQWVKKTTAPYKYPRILHFVDELPKTVGGKIKRAQIRAANAADAGAGTTSNSTNVPL